MNSQEIWKSRNITRGLLDSEAKPQANMSEQGCHVKGMDVSFVIHPRRSPISRHRNEHSGGELLNRGWRITV